MYKIQGRIEKISSFSMICEDFDHEGLFFIQIINRKRKSICMIKEGFLDSKWRNSIVIGQSYVFTNVEKVGLQDMKIDVKFPVYRVGSKSEVVSFNTADFGNHVLDSSSLKSLNCMKIGSYCGVVTSNAKAPFGIFELDNMAELVLSHIVTKTGICYPLCVGDVVTVHNCHIINSFLVGSILTSVLICCGASSIEVCDKNGNPRTGTNYDDIYPAFFSIIRKHYVDYNYLTWLIGIWTKLSSKFRNVIPHSICHSKHGPIYKIVTTLFDETSSFPSSSQHSLLEEFFYCPEQCNVVPYHGACLRFENLKDCLVKVPTVKEILEKCEALQMDCQKYWNYEIEKLPEHHVIIAFLKTKCDGKTFIQDATGCMDVVVLPKDDSLKSNQIIIIESADIVQENFKGSSRKIYLIANSNNIKSLPNSNKNNSNILLSSTDKGDTKIVNSSFTRRRSSRCSTKKKESSNDIAEEENKVVLRRAAKRKRSSFDYSRLNMMTLIENLEESNLSTVEQVLTRKTNSIVHKLEVKLIEITVAKPAQHLLQPYRTRNSRVSDNKTAWITLNLTDSKTDGATIQLVLASAVHVRQITEQLAVLPRAILLISNISVIRDAEKTYCRPSNGFAISVKEFPVKLEKSPRMENEFRIEESEPSQVVDKKSDTRRRCETVKRLSQAYVQVSLSRPAFVDQVCTLENILKFSVFAKCSSCQTPLEFSRCGYVGCHSNAAPHFNYEASVVIHDGSFRAKLFLKGDSVKDLLKLSGPECNLLQTIVSWHGQGLYDKVFNSKVRHCAYSANNFVRLASLLCDRPSVFRQVLVKGRPYLQKGKMKLFIYGLHIEEIKT